MNSKLIISLLFIINKSFSLNHTCQHDKILKKYEPVMVDLNESEF